MVNIQGIYIALFGRPADPAGLSHFDAVAAQCGDYSWLDNLVASSEYGLRLQGMSLEGAINTIYQNLFDRNADQHGLDFFVGELTAGRLTTATLAVAILDGATGTDRAVVDAKIGAAELFTLRLDTSVEIMAYNGPRAIEIGQNFVDGVTASAPATENDVDNAIMMLVRSGGQFEAGEVRDQPILTTTTLNAIEEGGSRLITQADLLTGATDPQGLSLSALHLELVGDGALISNGDGTWTFTAAPGDESEVSFTYVVTNGWSLPVATKAFLDVTPDAPMPAMAPWANLRIEAAHGGRGFADDIGTVGCSYDIV